MQQLSVQFCFHAYADGEDDDSVTCIAEPQSASEIEQVQQALIRNHQRSGELIISADGEKVHIKDSLDALVMQLCFESLSDLIAKKHVVVGHYLVYGYIRLDPEGDLTLISGDFIEKVRVPRDPLLAALFAAGERYIEVIKKLHQSTDAYGDLLETLEEYRTDAAAVMAGGTPSDQE